MAPGVSKQRLDDAAACASIAHKSEGAPAVGISEVRPVSVRDEDLLISAEEFKRAEKLLIVVPYSLHCCFDELVSFVKAIQPEKVHGIVAAKKNESPEDSKDPAVHFCNLLAGLQQ